MSEADSSHRLPARRFIPEKLAVAWRLLESTVAEGRAPAVAAVVGSSEETSGVQLFGRQAVSPDAPPLRPDAIFLIASPTKPIVAMAVMLLVEEGLIQLQDPISRFVPEFAAQGKRSITIAHCLTHTSGLPDMLPENTQLRAAAAPLSEFVARACQVKLNYLPGRDVQYQSIGYLMLGEVVRLVTGLPIAHFLRERVFTPLEMHDTALGRDTEHERIAEIRVAGVQLSGATYWNDAYWRRLGVPWGGILSTPADLGKLCRHLLAIHRGATGILSPASLAAMTRNQLATMPDVPEIHRRCFPWGYGWQMHWPAHATTFGDLLSPAAYGHWGASGALVWIDPARDAFAVALTTEPLELGRRWLAKFSNAVCAALA